MLFDIPEYDLPEVRKYILFILIAPVSDTQ